MNKKESETMKRVCRRITRDYIRSVLAYRDYKTDYTENEYYCRKDVYCMMENNFPFEFKIENVWRAKDGEYYVDELGYVHDRENKIITP